MTSDRKILFSKIALAAVAFGAMALKQSYPEVALPAIGVMTFIAGYIVYLVIQKSKSRKS